MSLLLQRVVEEEADSEEQRWSRDGAAEETLCVTAKKKTEQQQNICEDTRGRKQSVFIHLKSSSQEMTLMDFSFNFLISATRTFN